MSGFRRGTRLGVDVGKARVGVARCDPDGMLATPLETLPRDEATADRVRALASEHDAVEIVVGLPLNMRGDETPSTQDAREFADALTSAGIPVRLVDERLSTVTAHAAMRSVGRSQKKSRGIIDQVAAVVILQHAIDTEKRMGTPPGFLSPSFEEHS